jgi:hypothetical protein
MNFTEVLHARKLSEFGVRGVLASVFGKKINDHTFMRV